MTTKQEQRSAEVISKKITVVETVYACPAANCEKLFKSRYALTRHSSVHGTDKPHRCDVCGKGFSLPQYLREYDNIHTGAAPYLCGVEGCQKRFRQAGKLSIHRRSHKGYVPRHYNFALNPKPQSRQAAAGHCPPATPQPRLEKPAPILTQLENFKPAPMNGISQMEDLATRPQSGPLYTKNNASPQLPVRYPWGAPSLMQPYRDIQLNQYQRPLIPLQRVVPSVAHYQSDTRQCPAVPTVPGLQWGRLPRPVPLSPIFQPLDNAFGSQPTGLHQVIPLPLFSRAIS